jgi:hypothetical protein
VSVILELTEGWTAELGPFTLYQAPNVVQPLDTFTVEIELRNASGVLITPGGVVRVASPASLGQVYYTPAAGDFVAGRLPYTLRWKVTDVAGHVVYFPNGDADTIAVFPK